MRLVKWSECLLHDLPLMVFHKLAYIKRGGVDNEMDN